MKLPIYQVDAFASSVFRGNPAAVCPLDSWLPDSTLQAIAAENNLAETAFFAREQSGIYHLRWFTPTIEVPLCGHATVASGYVLYNELGYTGDTIRFMSKKGELLLTRQGAHYVLNFPAYTLEQLLSPPEGLIEALGATPTEIYRTELNYLVRFDSEAEVRALRPDFHRFHKDGIIATARGDDYDFVSRYFAPFAGIYEDPVTGSAHCSLTPYWSKQTGATSFKAFQASERGGELHCSLHGDRVHIAGEAVLYLKGEIYID